MTFLIFFILGHCEGVTAKHKL